MSTDSELSQQLKDLHLALEMLTEEVDTTTIYNAWSKEDVDRVQATILKIIQETEHAKAMPDGISDMALAVLKEQGFTVHTMDHTSKSEMIRPFLDLSTAHLTEDDATWLQMVYEQQLDVDLGLDLHGSDGEYGYWLYAEYEDSATFGKCPPSVQDVMRFARNKGCDWICLDRDASALSILPSYEW